MDKKFDSPEKIFEVLKEQKIAPKNMYFGFISVIYSLLLDHSYTINGAPAEDFFIQGLIAITGNPESFKVALDEFMYVSNMNY